MVPTLFALVMFASAALAFLIQPMVGKHLLPALGGTPGVWNSCLVFFQAALLFGYALVHGLSRLRIGFGARLGLHAVLLAGAGATIFFGDRLVPNESWLPTDSESPTAAVLAVLAMAVGAPYLALATTAPLLQAWYARLGRDPYPLYAASNLGSFAGLLSYPFLVEPALALNAQRGMWIVGFGGVALLVLACGAIAARGRAVEAAAAKPEPAPARGRILKWIALAALPSSLLMSATTHLTTDIAPVPLLWVVPLGLYLLSFSIVFARWSPSARKLVGRLTPMALCFLTVALLTRANTPMILVGGVHLVAFFLVALLCHGEVAADRPAPAHLTGFYLWISIGGVLGGLANAFLSPWLFAQVGNLEYPLAIVLAGFVRPPSAAVGARLKPMDGIWPFALGALTALFVVGVPWLVPDRSGAAADDALDRLVRGGLSFGIPAAFAFALVWRPVRFALCLAMLLAVGSLAPNPHGTVLETHRDYFGTLRVARSADGRFHRIVHGTTLHGQQKLPFEDPPEPATYYHRKGPFGRLMEKLPPARRSRVAVVGLGCGATAAYAEMGQRWTFYEIDPAVARVAQDERYFTFLKSCPADYEIVLGDARRQLRRAADGTFDLIVLDAFSSDAVPVHLLTREAFALYFAKLKPGGTLALHVSNRYLDLPPIIARTVAATDGPRSILVNDDLPNEEDARTGQTGSTWMVVSSKGSETKLDARWQPVPTTAGSIWTDDFSNLLGAWRVDE
jgi:protein-L-isoaspartate O-methyltransferase